MQFHEFFEKILVTKQLMTILNILQKPQPKSSSN